MAVSSNATTGGRRHFVQGRFFKEAVRYVYGPRRGGAKILFDAVDAELGAGKTSAAVGVGRFLARVFGYDISDEDCIIAGSQYLDRYQEHDPGSPSVILTDELVGGGAGDARRSMSNENIDLARAWQLQRNRRVVTIGTLPDSADLDKRMLKLANFLCICHTKPIGRFVAYKLGTWKFGQNKGQIKYTRLSSELFPDATVDPLYETLDDKKSELIESEFTDATELDEATDSDNEDGDGEWPDRLQIELAKELRKDGRTWQDIADNDRITYSREWVRQNTTEALAEQEATTA